MSTYDALPAFRTVVAAALRDAMKAKHQRRRDALRALLHDLDNATAVAVPDRPQRLEAVPDVQRRVLGADAIRGVIMGAVAERQAAATEYRRLDRMLEAERLDEEAAVIKECLEDVPGGS